MSKIARVWIDQIPSSRVEEYLSYVEKTGVKDLLATPQNEGVLLLKRTDRNVTELSIISFWESLTAIQEFAGNDIRRAVYYPEDHKFLLKMDPELNHYEIHLAKGIKF